MIKVNTAHSSRPYSCDVDAFNIYASLTSKFKTLPKVLANHIAHKHNTEDKIPVRILDVGCGPGQLTIPFLEHLSTSLTSSIDYTGIDCDESAITANENELGKINKPVNKTEYIHGRIEEKDVIDRFRRKFDIIICSHVLYYIEEWRRLIFTLRRLLNKDGELCVILVTENETLSPVQTIIKDAGIAQNSIEPKAEAFHDWLITTDCIFFKETHGSTFGATQKLEKNKEESAESLAKCFGFFSGIRDYKVLYDYASENVDKTFKRKENVFWIQKNTTRKRITDLTCLSQSIYNKLDSYIQPSPSSSKRQDYKEKDIEERAEILKVLMKHKTMHPFDWIHGYLYDKDMRNNLVQSFAYLAGGYIVWKDNNIIALATDKDIGENVLRPPFLNPFELKGLLYAFRSMLLPPDKDFIYSIEPNSNNAISEQWHKANNELEYMRKLFPNVTKKELDDCIKEELALFFGRDPSETNKINNICSFFDLWIEKGTEWSYKVSEVADKFKILSSAAYGLPEVGERSGYRAFWFIAFGAFLRCIVKITGKYNAFNAVGLNPYKKAHEEGNDFWEPARIFYTPHAKILSAFAEIALHIKKKAMETIPVDSWKNFQKSLECFLIRVGTVSKGVFVNRLSDVPEWLDGNDNLIRDDLAGMPVNEVLGFTSTFEPRTDSIDDLYKCLSFSPHNIYHYLAADNAIGDATVRRAVVWFPLQQLNIGEEKSQVLERDLLMFVANIDELKMYGPEKVVASQLLGLKTIFGQIGRLCVDTYWARGLMETGIIQTAARIGHAFQTPLSSVISKVKSLPDDIKQRAILNTLESIQNLEKFSRIVCKGEKAFLDKEKKMNIFKEQFLTTLQDLCSIYEDIKVSDVYSESNAVKKQYRKLFSAIKRYYKVINKDCLVSWNEKQLYIAIDGVLKNALRNINLDQPLIEMTIEALEDFNESGVFLICRNSVELDINEAKDLAYRLSSCNNIDWIGVYLLHISSEAVGFPRPQWIAEASKDKSDLVFLKARVQIGLRIINERRNGYGDI